MNSSDSEGGKKNQQQHTKCELKKPKNLDQKSTPKTSDKIWKDAVSNYFHTHSLCSFFLNQLMIKQQTFTHEEIETMPTQQL